MNHERLRQRGAIKKLGKKLRNSRRMLYTRTRNPRRDSTIVTLKEREKCEKYEISGVDELCRWCCLPKGAHG